MSLSDQVREVLATDPTVRGPDVARILGLDLKTASAMLSYARRSPKKGGASGRGGNGGARPTGAVKEPQSPAVDSSRWPALSAPLLAFLRGSPSGRTHEELGVWMRTESRLNGPQLVNALAWLEGAGLARSTGEREPEHERQKHKDGASRAHLVRWIANVSDSGERNFGEF